MCLFLFVGDRLAVIHPEMASDTANSLFVMTQQGGHLPRWPLANVYTGCMDGCVTASSHGAVCSVVGVYCVCLCSMCVYVPCVHTCDGSECVDSSHGVEVLADAITKGVPRINATALYTIMRQAIVEQDGKARHACHRLVLLRLRQCSFHQSVRRTSLLLSPLPANAVSFQSKIPVTSRTATSRRTTTTPAHPTRWSTPTTTVSLLTSRSTWATPPTQPSSATAPCSTSA